MFEYGDKIICIVAGAAFLTQDRTYRCLGETTAGLVKVVDDTGDVAEYCPSRFSRMTTAVASLPPFPFKIATASAMPGTNGGFTMVCFDGKEIPEGTKVYIFKE